jgi:signal transduction histidine kinase
MISIKKSIIYLFILSLLSLFMIIGYMVKDSYQTQEHLLTESLKNKAISLFNLIVDMRHWNAQYDGIYIKSETITPNPYLTPNQIKSDKNETLVWVNPAFMTRQIANIASQRDGFDLKITSTKPINRSNAPTSHEREILNNFEANRSAPPYYWKIEEDSFTFIGGLRMERACMSCHEKQGYRVGDIRGGISLSFDIRDEFKSLDQIHNNQEQTILFLFIAGVGTLLTLTIHQSLKRKDEEKISTLNHSLKTKIKELDHLNKNLHQRVQEELHKQRQKENMLIQQSKLAALGEMIGNIAHQWRQPISAVSAIMMNIKWTGVSQGIDPTFIDARIKEATIQLDYMSQTIDDFRSFFKPTKTKSYFNPCHAVERAYHILQASLEDKGIQFYRSNPNTMELYGYENEFSQVVLNLISNAKDMLILREIANPFIQVALSIDKENNLCCAISDNAKGVEERYLEKIFEPYFTSKKGQGTGIGLYIAKEIIEKHMDGSLHVTNNLYGATFIIKIPLAKGEEA